MPTYSYRCNACNNAFDIQQSFTDDSLTECPECGGDLRKLFSAVGIAFKGSGFYRNDHGAGAKPKTNAASTPDSTSGSEPAAAPAAPSTTSTPASTGGAPAPSAPASSSTT